ncbi:unnamed protein product, partial [Meganyctiphanes norvegica]
MIITTATINTVITTTTIIPLIIYTRVLPSTTIPITATTTYTTITFHSLVTITSPNPPSTNLCKHRLLNMTSGYFDEHTEKIEEEDYTMIIAMTIVYIVITIMGLVGNVATCIVISKNRVMHTATNYYLFSMAISDLLLLVVGMPNEMHSLWYPAKYLFGEVFCIIRGLAAETSTNASILTICAFTVERYIGICHPLRSHTMSNLGRVTRFIIIIWIGAVIFAVPQAAQYGIVYEPLYNSTMFDLENPQCNIKFNLGPLFEISTFLFFCTPMVLILVLYVKIALELHKSSNMARAATIGSLVSSSTLDRSRNKAVIKMLVAVVIAFFVCWAPFHAQRLMSIYGDPGNKTMFTVYTYLNHISGILYYLSTCVNPILYHTMSNRFRQALQVTLSNCFSSKNSCSDSDADFLNRTLNGMGSLRNPCHLRGVSLHQTMRKASFKPCTTTTTTSTNT